MQADQKFNRILVDLDSLLDIRQGILSKLMSEEKLADYISSEEYNFRTIDNFSSVADMDKYNYFNTNRTKDIISAATVAQLFTVLKKKIHNLERKNAHFNEHKLPELYINIYPFTLSTAEQDTLINIVFTKLNTEIFIKTVYIAPKDITPYFLRNTEIVEVFIYDSRTWLDLQLDNIYKSETKLHDIRINFPAICAEAVTEDIQMKLDKLGFKDVFSLMEYIASGYAVFNFLPTIFYSNVIIAKSYLDKFNKENSNKSIAELFPDCNDDK